MEETIKITTEANTSNQTRHPEQQVTFDELLEGLKTEDTRFMSILEGWMGHPFYDIVTDSLFVMTGQKSNSHTGEEEHFWYDWDIGKVKTGILLDNECRVIHASSFKIVECWHRKNVKVKPMTTITISQPENMPLKVKVTSMECLDDVELTGDWFEAADALLDQSALYEESEYDDLYFGFNVMNLTAFHWYPNILCRY
jgi:hypothetical protein